ncbi:zinc finger, CCHC-type containing protein [Tanacetum coccineum]|uniref:Zinc finger, CCHC-type containing protein n=1 Tax=Tanacetum coccineum TaxID=301880 RepID=A0ABQ4XTB8_9ASTR
MKGEIRGGMFSALTGVRFRAGFCSVLRIVYSVAHIRCIFLDGYGVLDVRIVFFRFLRLSSRMRAFLLIFTKTSKDNEDPNWSTSFKTRRTQKTSLALEVLWKTSFYADLESDALGWQYISGTLPDSREFERIDNPEHLEEIHVTSAHLEKKRTRMQLYTKSLEEIRIQTVETASRFLATVNWLERLPVGSISTWEDHTTRFLAQFFQSGRIAKLWNDILMFQQYQGESLSEAWTRLKDLLQKVPHHDIDLWLKDPSPLGRILLLVSLLNSFHREGLQNSGMTPLMFQQHQGESFSEAWTLDYATEGRLRKMSAEKAWATIEELARYEDEGWNDPILPDEGSINHKNPNIEQLLGVMKSHVDTLMKDAISIIGRSENIFGISSDTVRQLPLEPSRQKAFKDLVMNFILDQEEKVRQLEEYMCVIGSDFI